VDDDGRGESFDSFGRRPTKQFEAYTNKHCAVWPFDKNINISLCGYIIAVCIACVDVEESK